MKSPSTVSSLVRSSSMTSISSTGTDASTANTPRPDISGCIRLSPTARPKLLHDHTTTRFSLRHGDEGITHPVPQRSAASAHCHVRSRAPTVAAGGFRNEIQDYEIVSRSRRYVRDPLDYRWKAESDLSAILRRFHGFKEIGLVEHKTNPSSSRNDVNPCWQPDKDFSPVHFTDFRG